MNSLYAGAMGFLAEGGGVLIGILLLYFFRLTNKRVIGMLFGCTSGIMMAMICFEILPEALSAKQDSMVLVGIIIGILLGILMQEFSYEIEHRMEKRRHSGQGFGTGLVLLMGIGLHSIPEGFALGALAGTSPDTIGRFAMVLALHSIPEAIAIAIPFKMAGTKLHSLLWIPVGLGSIMGFGAVLGYVMSMTASHFITIMLGAAAGIILYIVCEELLPESRKVWNGRMTTLAIIAGILVGMTMLGIIF
ncbi:MAG: ZIP family metal transporter [Cellulosilyticaceae bacterium]